MEDQPLSQPIRAGCRVCGDLALEALTVCRPCGAKVKERMGGVDDWLVRKYIGLFADAPASKVPLSRDPYAPKPKTVRCVCGRLYSREIAVLACEARDHQLPKEPDYV